MENFIINGPSKLRGRVEISGSKNEALKLIPLAISLKNKVRIGNVPRINDIFSQLEIFQILGGKAVFEKNLMLDATRIDKYSTVCKPSRNLRASIVYLGPLLSRFKKVQFPFPGGCAIGSRSISTHLEAFRDLGASIKERSDTVCVSLERVSSEKIKLREKSVSATENVFLYLASTDNDVVVENCAIEPEIMHLADILRAGGAKIDALSERAFRIKGSACLGIEEIEVMPDRIEAGTFLIAFAATGGAGEIFPFQAKYLETPLRILKSCGVKFECADNKCTVFESSSLKSFEIVTSPYPGFPTDLQSPMALIASRSAGTSVLREEMFENRLNYLDILSKMGLKYKLVNKHEAQIIGPSDLNSAEVVSPDLRAGITILVAATMAKGRSVIKGAEVIDRGYENIEEKLSKLGANITRSDG